MDAVIRGNGPRPMVRTLIAASAGLVLLAACSSGGGSGSGATTTSASTAFSTIPIATTTTVAPAPGQGGGTTGSTSPGGASGSTYTVVSGDYPIGIAKKLGVTLQALLDANGMTLSSFNLVPGQKLTIPAATGGTATTAAGGSSSSATTAAATTTTIAPDAPGTYTVRANDGWSIIASRLGVSADDLAAFNDMTLNSVLMPGMKLKIPPSRTTTTTTG